MVLPKLRISNLRCVGEWVKRLKPLQSYNVEERPL